MRATRKNGYETAAASPSGGPATDAQNVPVVDPTANVLAVISMSNRRQDDLREMSQMYEDKIATLRSKHIAELASSESERVDAIHAADEAGSAREAIVNAAQTAQLAKQVTDTAEAVRISSEAQRTAMVDLLSTTMEPVNKSLAELTKALYSGEGGNRATLEARTEQRSDRGESRQAQQVWLAAGGFVVILLAALLSFLAAHFH